MPGFIKFCNKLNPLSEEAVIDFETKLKQKEYEKGSYLLRQDKLCRDLFFIRSGLVKMFCYADGKEFIMNFFLENNMFTVLDSFPQQTSSQYNIIALEDTEVEYISYQSLEQICRKHHSAETFYRKLLLRASFNMMHRINEMLIQNPTEYYHQFVEENSELVQRIHLGDLASYLGITQVSLSRIRAKK